MANSSESAKKQESASELPPPQPSPTSQFINVKAEPQEFHNPPPEPIAPPAPDAEAILKSVSELGGLSAAINLFKCRFDELQNHLNFIDKSIDARFKDLTGSSSSPTRLPMATAPIENLAPRNDDSEPMHDVGDGDAPKERLLEHLCQTMCSRGLRKQILSRLSDIPKLREEVPAALKLAPNPAKLVFECIGRFFLQGSRAYTKGSHMESARQASVLVMEFFLLMMGDCADGEVEIEASVKQEANAAAIAWRKRVIAEGGIRKACLSDARGLLLLIACFGIPAEFRSEDIRNLIILSNPSEISEALRRSRVLVPKIPDIIEAMQKYGLYIEAVDVVYTFGIEDKHPPQRILISFLRETKEASKKTRRDAPFPVLIEAKLKELNGLKSVIKCLEYHKVDPTKVIPGWQVKEKMVSLEKEIAELDLKILDKVTQKRKMDEAEASLALRSHELKRSRFTRNGSPLMSRPIIGLHEPRTSMYADGIGGHYPGLYGGIHEHSLVDNGGHIINEKVPSYMWRGSGSAIFGERSIGRSYAGHHASVGMGGLSPSIEGFVGLPSHHSSMDPGGRGLGSDLYKFADL